MLPGDIQDYITVYESGTVCGVNWAMVNIAKDMADKGHSVEEIVKVLDHIKANDRNHMLPQDFAMVQRGGRVSEEERKLDPSLNIVPVLAFNEDKSRFVALSVEPSLKPAVEKVIEQFKNTGVDGKYFITIAQSYCMEDAEMAKAMLDEAFPDCSKKSSPSLQYSLFSPGQDAYPFRHSWILQKMNFTKEWKAWKTTKLLSGGWAM